MSTELGALAPGILAALEEVQVAPTLLSAVVAGREVTEDSSVRLRRALVTALYEVFHCGQGPEPKPVPLHLRDSELEGALADEVPHSWTRVSAEVCLPMGAASKDGMVLVEREGVRVWMPEDAIIDGSPVPGATVALQVSPVRPALSVGHFLVDGSVGGGSNGPLLRVYVSLEHLEGAREAWSRVLGCLEASRVPYRAKVLSAAPLFPRNDGLVAYLPEQGWHLGAHLADVLSDVDGIGEGTSVFAERLGPGVARAWEPTDPRPQARGLSFGEHRAMALADALIDCARTQEPLEAAAVESLVEANVDPSNPARNSDSPVLEASTLTARGHPGGEIV